MIRADVRKADWNKTTHALLSDDDSEELQISLLTE